MDAILKAKIALEAPRKARVGAGCASPPLRVGLAGQ
jgi:hypothetical protein